MKQITIYLLPNDARSFIAPFEDDYAFLLVVASDSVSDDQRDQIASDVVRSSCQYALTFGPQCEAWHDAIDSACFHDGVTKDRFLMTTWHSEEPIEDVVDFLWWNTFYEDFEAEHLAVVLIGSDPALEAAIRKRAAYHQKRQDESREEKSVPLRT
jgi:hypothetical protein